MSHVQPPEPGTLCDRELALVPWSELDLRALEQASDDVEITRITAVPEIYTTEAGRAFIADRERAWESGQAFSLAIHVTFDGAEQTAGAVNLNGIDREARSAHVGYWVISAARGNGYARRALALIVRWGFQALDLAEIDLRVEPANERSERVARACGFQAAGELLEAPFGSEQPLPLRRFLLRAGG